MAASVALQVIVSPLLGTVFNSLGSLIQTELSLVLGVKKDLEKLSSLLSTILAVMQDAEDKQITDRLILDWLRKLKDAAYDAEDVIDECATEALAPAGSETIHEVHNKSLLSCFVFKRIIFRRAIGKRIKNLIERFNEIAGERLKFHLNLSSLSNGIEARVNRRETSSIQVETQVYGRDDEKKNIVKLLVSYSTAEGDAPQGGVLALSVCPILGMGGLGKTTLAQMVYHDQRIVNHFAVRCWVCVSENFDVKTLLRDIIISCGGKAQDLDKLDHLQNRLKGILSGKRFLLVLDDVWNEDESKWDKLKSSLACGGNGSSIIVTTRLATTARIMGTLQTCSPKVLSEEECWSLLRHRAFGLDNQDPDLEAIGKEIAKKCGGIPLAAKALGGLLRFKREVNDWSFVRDSKIWDLPQDKEDAIVPALMLSYNHLPSNSKQCFAYCSIFPKDYLIEKEKLIQLWMANGFIQGNKGRGGMEVEDIASEIFDDLLWRSFFQEPKEYRYGNVESYKMHDLVHDLACSITRNECSVVQFADAGNTVGKRTRHLSLNFQDRASFVAYRESFTSKSDHLMLRSFLLMDFWRVNTCCPRLRLPHFETLRVLDLNHMNLATFPMSICELKHLRYLDLSWTRIKSLPESICELMNLQTLKLTNTDIKMLPKRMNEMTGLRHLYGCDNLTASMPIGMGRMTSLRTLNVFVVGTECGCGLGELQGLNHLRGRLAIRGLENIRDLMEAKSANLMGKEKLHELVLCWLDKADSSNTTVNQVQVQQQEEEEEEELMLEQGLQPHPNLKSIEIQNYGGRKTPSWMMLLPNLVEVILLNCKRCERLPPLGQLPLLRILSIRGMDYLECFGDEFCGDRGFPNLEKLHISEMPNLEKLWSSCSSSEQGTLFPKLQTLIIDGMDSLKCIGNEFCGDGGFPHLKHLELRRMPNLEKLWPSCSSTEQKTLFPTLISLCISIFPKLITCTPFPSSVADLLLELDIGVPITSAADLQWMTGMKVLLQHLTSLKTLSFDSFHKLEALPVELLLQNRTQVDKLWIYSCKDLVSLPNGFPNLISLNIDTCPEMKFLHNDLQHFVSLETLRIYDCSKLTSLPEGLRNVAGTLHSLMIDYCSGLTSLPEWIGSFTALRTMEIAGCKNLKCLPKGLKHLTSLKTLAVHNCHPDLHKRCRKEKGEDWHKISHIPELDIIVDSDIDDTEKDVQSRLISLPTCCSSSV